jgi:phosphoglycerate dehydrogenase-like enzyme
VPIAEYVMTVMLLQVTHFARYAKTFRRGSWEGSGRCGGAPHNELHGKSVGLIGFGHIGREVAARALAFGMHVFAIRQNTKRQGTPSNLPLDWLGDPADLDRLLESADFVIVACALSDRTRGMLGPKQLARMKASGMLVNIARAEIVDEDALFEALRHRRIEGAALDAWYRYPVSPDEMLHGSRLPFHELPNVIVTPHMSGWSSGTLKRRQDAIGRNLDRLARNEPLLNVVLEGKWRPE